MQPFMTSPGMEEFQHGPDLVGLAFFFPQPAAKVLACFWATTARKMYCQASCKASLHAEVSEIQRNWMGVASRS